MSAILKYFFTIRICLFGIGLIAHQAYGYNLSGVSWQSGAAAVHVDLAASNPPGANQPNIYFGGPTTLALQNAYVDALDIWATVSAFNFSAIENSGAADICPSASIDPRSGVAFSYTDCGGTTFGPSTLAVQQTWSSSGSITKTGTLFNNNLQWDLYDGDAQFDFGGGIGVFRPEFKRVAVHELGHGLGLNHSGDGSAIMTPSAGDTETPQTDDLNGTSFLYDKDSDGIGIANDNCPGVANPDQLDLDNDGEGDLCDADIDGDGIYNSTALDQSHGVGTLTSFFNLAGAGQGGARLAQTFTVGITGNLDKVTLPVFCNAGNLQISIQTVNGSNPSGTIIDSAVFSQPLPDNGFIDFELNNVGVVSGNLLAIVVYSSGSCGWTNTNASGYGGGSGRFSNNGVNWFGLGEDLPFQTHITPSQFDNCPVTVNPGQQDSDMDGVGDVCEAPSVDTDIDGVDDAVDNCPANPNPGQENNDNDALGDVCDPDDDNDSINDGADNCPLISNLSQLNSDNDALGNACDPDDDNDSVADGIDNCPLIANADQQNTDNDALGNVCDPDDDNDTINDGIDNCPLAPNSGQENTDNDALGNICDPDDDNDNVDDGSDNCPLIPNSLQENTDADPFGNVCDADDDNDSVNDTQDNCQFLPNPGQQDNDGDNLGDMCDPDDDNDSVADGIDNCRYDFNPMQNDTNDDGVGDVCQSSQDQICFPIPLDSGKTAMICL